MDVQNGNLVTASGDSDPQMSAVGGQCSPQVSLSPSSTKSVGSPKQDPTANNGVGNATAAGGAKQAPGDGRTTIDVTATGYAKNSKDENPARTALRTLRKCLSTQDGGFKLLDQRARSLETWSAKVRSLDVKKAIEELLEVIDCFGESRDAVHKAYNVLAEKINRSTDQSQLGASSKPTGRTAGTQTSVSNTGTVTLTDGDLVAPLKQAVTSRSTQTVVESADVGTDTPCWWGTLPSLQQLPGKIAKSKPADISKPKVPLRDQREQQEQLPEEVEHNPSEFTVVKRRRRKRKQEANGVPPAVPAATSTKPPETKGKRQRRPPKTQAVVLEKPSKVSYADMVKEVKETVRQEALTFEITPRRTKAGNLVLETKEKSNADALASALKRRFGESRKVRRPSPSVALIIIGIEDSIDESELLSIIEGHDPDLKVSNEIKIREAPNGVRTAIIRVPVSPGLKLVHLKKLKVGWSKCRIKELAPKQGCARCSASDHATRECVAEDTRRCFRCKEVGHLMASCKPLHQDSQAKEPNRNKCTEVPTRSPTQPGEELSYPQL